MIWDIVELLGYFVVIFLIICCTAVTGALLAAITEALL